MGTRKRIVKTISNEEATEKVQRLKEEMQVDILAELLDISKMTLYVRLKSGHWKITERALIEKINEHGHSEA